jgi:hypothetical protein
VPVPAVSSVRSAWSGPEWKARPFGATSIQGYSGKLSEAVLSARRPPASVRTSGVSTRPAVMSISPLFKGVTVGYQRPAAMFGPRLQRFVMESKR